MADIYIAYASEDRLIAERLYSIFSSQWDTWWDDKIIGDFSQAIEREIPNSKCLVVIFSTSSRVKSTFTDELRIAKRNNINILAVRIDDSDPPYSFGDCSYTDLHNWNGQVDHPAILKLKRNVAAIVAPKLKPSRPIAIADGRVPLPSLFMSVSSHETQLIPEEAVEALRVFNASTILVSAFDLVRQRKPQKMITELKRYKENGGFVLIDSGNYEKSRLSAKHWKPSQFQEALENAPHDWVFAFDNLKTKHDPNAAIEEILTGIERDKNYTNAPILPIVHAPAKRTSGYKLETLPYVVSKVAAELEPPVIAIPERELGAGLIERARTVKAVRDELSNLPYYQPLHILGTGNPWSIALLAAAGADTFDGLEWCRFAIDRDKEKIHHFQHFDFFVNQSASQPFVNEALADPNVGYAGKVAFHNLDYFAEFMTMLRGMFVAQNEEAFLVGLLGKKRLADLKVQFPELLQ